MIFRQLYEPLASTCTNLLGEGQTGRAMLRSERDRLSALPQATLVYRAHDYQDRFVSSIAQQRMRNARPGADRTLEEFRQIMAGQNLPYPTFIDHAVPGKRQCGVFPSTLPEGWTGIAGR